MLDIPGGVLIVGAHEHPARFTPDKSEWQFNAEAAKGALDDAGFPPDQVDSFFTSSTASEGGDFGRRAAMMAADFLGMRPNFSDETDLGGASLGMPVGVSYAQAATGQLIPILEVAAA